MSSRYHWSECGTSPLTGRVERVVIVHLTPVRLALSELLSRVAAWHELAGVDWPTWTTVTGMPLSAPFPDGSSTNVDGDSALVLTPGEPLATDIRVPGLPRQAEEHRPAFRRTIKWRTGCKGRISTLKRGYGWDRTRIDGTKGTRIWTGHGVLAHNLVKISALAA